MASHPVNPAASHSAQRWLAFTPSFISAGFVAVLVGYSSAVAIVYQAALAAGASSAQASSWLWAVGVGMGVSSIGLSLYYRQPVFTAWSTPGAALLVSSVAGFSLAETIGAFIVCSLLMTLVALTGAVERLLKWVPASLAGALLAGVLLQFGLQVFAGMGQKPLLVGAMLLSFLVARHWHPRYSVVAALAVGVTVAYWQGALQWQPLDWQWSTPQWVTPEFSWSALMGIAVPLFAVTMASQNIPGLAVLRANGYDAPAGPLLAITGITGMVLAPFGGFAFNLSAMTAAICQSDEAGGTPAQRYWATCWGGVFYLLAGLLGATLVALLQMVPAALVATLAGLALLAPLSNGLQAAMQEPSERDVALLTFLVTASGLSLAGISSAFWGLLLGLLVHYGRKLRH
jgi:benzoate membrane transport protein